MFAQARDCLFPMGITSENVAQRYGITREEQDQAAVGFLSILFYNLTTILMCYFLQFLMHFYFRLNLIGKQLQQMLLENLKKK